jgi:hypothetical protein
LKSCRTAANPSGLFSAIGHACESNEVLGNALILTVNDEIATKWGVTQSATKVAKNSCGNRAAQRDKVIEAAGTCSARLLGARRCAPCFAQNAHYTDAFFSKRRVILNRR